MALDDADKKFISELIANSLKTHGEELGKKFVTVDAAGKMVEQGLAKGIDGLKLDEKLAKALEGVKPEGKGDDKAKAGKGEGDPALQKKLEALEAQLREQTAAKEAADRQAAEQRLDSAIGQALAAAGIPADRHKHVLPYLRGLKLDDGKPIISTDANGGPVWTAQRKGYTDALGLDAGIKEWVNTDDGKIYVPPVGAQGTGDGNGGRTGPRDTNVPRDANGKIDVSALRDKLMPAIGRAVVEQ